MNYKLWIIYNEIYITALKIKIRIFLDTIITKIEGKSILICDCYKNQISDRYENVDGALNALIIT